MASKVTQNVLYLMLQKAIDFSADSFIIILMKEGFVFNQGTHNVYADVSASELDTGNGYTQKTKVLTGVSITRDDSLFKAVVSWSNPAWNAAGGPIGPACGAIIIDDTVTDDPIVQWIDFGASGTESDGGTFTVSNPKCELTT